MTIATGEQITAADVLAAIAAAVVARYPSGMIAMWHGTIGDIPAGYVICDGNNSTPNLLTRFIQGVATAATNPGATGGATSKTATSRNGNYGVTEVNSSGEGVDSGAGVRDISLQTTSDIRPKYYDIAFIMKT